MMFFPFFFLPSPPVRQFWRWLAIAIVAAALMPAKAQESRSARWYANNHEARAQMVERCRNHPGPSRRSDQCAAAWQGNILAAEEEARRAANDNSLPTEQKYWTTRPMERGQHLKTCERMPEDWQARNFCGPARRSLGPARRA
jgi:hypothetical protein